MAEVFITPNDIAHELHCTVRTARGIVTRHIPHLRVGRAIRVKVGDYDHWKNRNRHRPQTPSAPLPAKDQQATPPKHAMPKFRGLSPSEQAMRERSKELAKQIREQAKRRNEQ